MLKSRITHCGIGRKNLHFEQKNLKRRIFGEGRYIKRKSRREAGSFYTFLGMVSVGVGGRAEGFADIPYGEGAEKEEYAADYEHEDGLRSAVGACGE